MLTHVASPRYSILDDGVLFLLFEPCECVLKRQPVDQRRPSEAVDQYALQWAKWEIVELSVLSSWKEMVKGQIEERISKLKQNFKQPTGKMLQNVDVKACLSDLHNKYVFVPADKAPNNIIIICKRYYIETLIKELGLDNCSTPAGISTCTSCQMSSEDIVNTHDTFMKFLGIELSDDDKRLPYLYWTPKLHKSPVKHRFIAGSSKCTSKQLSSLLTKILTVIKTGLEKYYKNPPYWS